MAPSTRVLIENLEVAHLAKKITHVLQNPHFQYRVHMSLKTDTKGWASQAAARGANLQLLQRRHRDNRKHGARNLEFPHANSHTTDTMPFQHINSITLVATEL